MKDRWKIILPLALMAVMAIAQWPDVSRPMAQALGLSDGQNFSVAYAMAFCAGVYFPRRWKWALPLAMFAIVNMLTNVHYGVSALHPYLFIKLAAFSALIWLGTRFSAKDNWFSLLGGGLIGALVFYIITNTASWWWDPAYQKNLLGWIQALTIGTGAPGLPPTIAFLFNSLFSGGLFTGLFTAAMKLTAADEVTEKEGEEVAEEQAEDDGGIVPAPEKSEA